MLSKIIHEITKISDNETINTENYMEALNFINTIFMFTNKLKLIVPTNQVSFLPSFKGRLTCEKFNLVSDLKENEMRYFITNSALFLEDETEKREKIRDILGPFCESIEFDRDRITFILR